MGFIAFCNFEINLLSYIYPALSNTWVSINHNHDLIYRLISGTRHQLAYKESGSFRSCSRSVRSFRPGSFRSDFRGESFRPDWDGSFRPNFKGGSFRPEFKGGSFRPDLFNLEKQKRYMVEFTMILL